MQIINKSEVLAFKQQMEPWPRMKLKRWNFRNQLEVDGYPSTILSNHPDPRASQLEVERDPSTILSDHPNLTASQLEEEGHPSTLLSNHQIRGHLNFSKHSRCLWASVLVFKRLLTPLWVCEWGSGGDLALLCLFWTLGKPDFSFVYIMAVVVLCFISRWRWRIWWHHWSVVFWFCSNL